MNVYVVSCPNLRGEPGCIEHYVSSLCTADRIAKRHNHLATSKEDEAEIRRITVPSLTPKRLLLWALNFGDHGESSSIRSTAARCVNEEVING